MVLSYARHLLSPDNALFLQDLARRCSPLSAPGLMNSLSQTVIKLTAPGVPDIYQGSEALNFSLVDPDNRREPDFNALVHNLSAADATVFDTRPLARRALSSSSPPRCCGCVRITTRFSATATGCRLRSPASARRT